MKNFIKITLSLVLAVILLATAMPIYAVEDDSIKEVEELREENVKHFEMPDGTFKAIVYSESVHRKDADGKWQDIDNTLSSEKENGNTNYSSFDGRIKFSKNIKNANGKILELSENGYKISFSLIDENIKSTSADVKNHKGKKTPTVFDSEKEKLDKLQSVDNLTKVRYNDIRKDIDLEYEIYANNIKESIIVNSKQSDYVYKFELKLNKLSAILNEDGSISLIDEKSGEEKYTMPAPFMFDDNGELSTDVYYTLTQNGKYKYELTVTADKEWINDSERNFPVTIDPTTVYVSTYYGEAYVSSANPNTNYCKPNDLMVGTTYRTFMKFEMPNIGAAVEILEATLNVKYYYNSTYGYMNVGMYAVPYYWNENTITWNNSVVAHSSQENSISNLCTEYLSAGYGISSSYPAEVHFDLTTTVRDWCAGVANNGVAIKYISGSTESLMIKGYNCGSDYRPTLELTYQNREIVFNGTYFFRNAQFNTYMQYISTTSENINVKTLPFDGDENQKWNITYLHNGYHVIISEGSEKALTATASSGDNLILTDYVGSTNQMWSITLDSNGYYRLSPRSNSSLYLASSIPSVQISTSNIDKRDEWILYKESNSGVRPESQQNSNWCWIACVRMLSSAYIDTNAIPLQEEIAISLNGSGDNYNSSGDREAVKNALRFVFGTVNVKEDTNGKEFKNDLLNLLRAGTPVITLIRGIDHYVIVYDYSEIENPIMPNGDNTLYLYIYDPLDGYDQTEVSIPYTRIVSYEDFITSDYSYEWTATIWIEKD